MELMYILELLFLIIETREDIENRELALEKLIFFFLIGLLLKIFWLHGSITELLSGMSVGMVLLGISYLSDEALGYGDGMVVLITGVLCGIKMTIVIVSFAFLVMSIAAMFLLVKNGFFYKARVPFVPCILAGFLGGIFL